MMRSLNDCEGAQDFLDDRLHKHVSHAYESGFRHGTLVTGILVVIAYAISVVLR